MVEVGCCGIEATHEPVGLASSGDCPRIAGVNAEGTVEVGEGVIVADQLSVDDAAAADGPGQVWIEFYSVIEIA